MPGPLPEPIRLTPRHKEWRNIIGELFDLGVDQWASVYDDAAIMDGSGWSLSVSSTELNVQSSGMNVYPKNFDAVQEVIERAAVTAPPLKKTSYARKPRKCPNCGRAPVVSILYGEPSISDELFEKEQRGEVIFGGCVIEPGQPTWQCSKCGAEFFKAT